MDNESSIQTLQRMHQLYGTFIENSSLLELDSKSVPVDLIPYIPYAALWGISDDLEREQFIVQAPEVAKKDLARIVEHIDDLLDDWLASDEANSLDPSDEYVAFSAMRMAADFL